MTWKDFIMSAELDGLYNECVIDAIEDDGRGGYDICYTDPFGAKLIAEVVDDG